MLGIIIATLIAAWTVFVSKATMVAGFLAAIHFLWIWYWIWTAVVGSIIVVMMLMMIGTLATSGASMSFFHSRWLGGLVGLTVGGGLSIFVLVITSVTRALLLVGTYLLMTAGNAGMNSFSEFDSTKLIFGGILLLLGLIMSRGSSSKSNSKSSS